MALKFVTEALKWVSNLCKVFNDEFVGSRVEAKSFYSYPSMLSKQKHSIWLLEKNNSCFGVNALIEFLNYRFKQHIKKEAATPKFSTKRLLWKVSRMSGFLFS